MQKLLNLGCGSRFSKDPVWVNLDAIHSSEGIVSHNLSQGIPFASQTFDAVYHSQLLEHFSKDEGLRLVKECFRVLRPGGIIRIVVPDLENICRLYLKLLEKIESGDRSCISKYDWIMIEMFDQMTRIESGGEMEKHMRRQDLQDKDFIIERIGSIGREMLSPPSISGAEVKEKNDRTGFNYCIGMAKRAAHKIRSLLMPALLSKREIGAIKIGIFRTSGEVHRWAYDRNSLRRLFEEVGFVDVRQCSARESNILEWDKYLLDINADGSVHAPSSVYMEGVKPA